MGAINVFRVSWDFIMEMEKLVSLCKRRGFLFQSSEIYGGLNGFGAKVNEVLNCHGLGHCGTCRVKITKGMENTSPMSISEKFTFKYNPLGIGIFAYIGNEDTMRLACCTRVEGDMTVETKPPMNLTGENFFS